MIGLLLFSCQLSAAERFAAGIARRGDRACRKRLAVFDGAALRAFLDQPVDVVDAHGEHDAVDPTNNMSVVST